jgi:hypothetical protein
MAKLWVSLVLVHSLFPESYGAEEVMGWMLSEFEALPEVLSNASDFAASFSVESLLKLLENCDCIDFEKFKNALQKFPDAGSTSLIRSHKDVRAVEIKFMKEFWVASGKEFAKKITREKLEEVTISLNSKPFSLFLLCGDFAC